MENSKVFMSGVHGKLFKGVIVQRDGDVIMIKITSRNHNAWPYKTGMMVETRQEFLSYR